MIKWILIFLLPLPFALAETKPKEQIIYKYKKVETFDLGEIDIKGNVIGPGDLSVKFRKRQDFSENFKSRKNFDPEIAGDLRELD